MWLVSERCGDCMVSSHRSARPDFAVNNRSIIQRHRFQSHFANLEHHATRRVLFLVIVLSALHALMLSIAFWPGLATNDSGHRLCLSWSLIHGRSAGPTHMPESTFQQVFPPAMSLVAAGLRWTTGSWGVMTLLGAWWFFASVGALSIAILGRNLGLFAWLAISATPLVWNHALAMLPDAWVGAAICTILAILTSEPHGNTLAFTTVRRRRGHVLLLALLATSGIVLFTFRHNSVTLLPMLLILAVLGTTRATPIKQHSSCPGRRGLCVTVIVTMLCVVTLSFLLPIFTSRALGWRTADVPATILAWEHVGVLRLAGDRSEELIATHSLDHVCDDQPADATRLAIKQHDWVAFNSIVYGDGAPLPAKGLRDDGVAMREAFWSLVKDEPILYARCKLKVWASVMGMRHDGPLIVITANPPRWTERYGVDLSQTHPVVDASNVLTDIDRLTRSTMWLWMPYAWFGCALLTMAFACSKALQNNSARSLISPIILVITAASYYAGFLIISPGFEWRYFLPSFVLLVLAVFANLRIVFARIAPTM